MFHTQSSLTPIKSFWDLLELTLESGLTLPLSIQDFGQKSVKLLMKINVVMLHKVVETMAWRMHTIINILEITDSNRFLDNNQENL